MRLDSVEIRNFRAIEHLALRLHPQLTILHGANGSGKTSVLRAIAVGLGTIPSLLPGVSGIGFRESDPRIGSRGTGVTLRTACGGAWSRTRGSGGVDLFQAAAPGVRWLRTRMDRIVAADRNGQSGGEEPLRLPIAAWYDTERAVLDIPQRRRGFAKEFPRYGALQGALSVRVNFREAFQWFYFHENAELREQRERRDLDHQSPELRAVRTAISRAVGDVSEPRIRLRPLRFEVSLKSGDRIERLDLARLSGGYQAVLALVTDLARRMAQGNPHLPDPLESDAIVLIDEVDLHLHPSWQQRVLGDLTRTFPNAQFVVTTHSPQVLTSVEPDNIVELAREDGRVVAGGPPAWSLGAEAGGVLLAVMGVDQRPVNEFSTKLTDYRRLIARGLGESAEGIELRRRLDELSPRDPGLDSADLALRRQAVLKKMGGASG